MLASIGGSGLTQLANLQVMRRKTVRTPYGRPSGPLIFGKMQGRAVVFLARHGANHTIPPHAVNYRANLWALHAQKVKNVVSVATVGGIRAGLAPGTLVVPDQIIDYTHGRQSSYSGTRRRGVLHIDFTRPYCEALRQRLLGSAAAAGEAAVAGGTYAATQGPRLETAAEINRLERDGADIVGMTAMPEAALAREIGLCYAAIVVVVNHAAGRGASTQGILLKDAEAITKHSMARILKILDRMAVSDGD